MVSLEKLTRKWGGCTETVNQRERERERERAFSTLSVLTSLYTQPTCILLLALTFATVCQYIHTHTIQKCMHSQRGKTYMVVGAY